MSWREIDEFSGYSVSHEGRIRNNSDNRVMTMTRNQQGVLFVGLTRDKVQYRRGVALLVAKAFLDPPTLEAFNTPINLNGQRDDNHIDNLMWRPRWFAISYHQQFHNGKRGFKEPVREIKTGEKFKTSWHAAIKYGLLDREIMLATINRTYVWPTYQEFRLIE